jgi:hypothetical protein
LEAAISSEIFVPSDKSHFFIYRQFPPTNLLYITNIPQRYLTTVAEAELGRGSHNFFKSVKNLKVYWVEDLLPIAFLHAFENLDLKSVCGKYI